MGPDDAGDVIDAYEACFGLAFVGSFDTTEDDEDSLVHICMVVGQHCQETRLVLARCGRASLRAVVRVAPTCFACIAREYSFATWCNISNVKAQDLEVMRDESITCIHCVQWRTT